MSTYPATLGVGDDEALMMVAISAATGLMVVCIVASVIKSVARERLRETSRREIAAYVAEGTITPEEGERLMKASPPGGSRCC